MSGMRMTVQQWLNWTMNTQLGRPFFPQGDIVIGLVRYDAAANMFRIYMGQGDRDGTYDMEASRITRSNALLDFILQVHSKEWATAQHLKDLLDCVTCWAYRETGKFPQEFFGVMGEMSQD